MSTRAIILAFCMFALGLPAIAEDPPALKEPPARLLETINSTARANFTAACMSLARDVRDKRLTVYAVVSTAKTGITTNEAGFTIEVLYHGDLAKERVTATGSYQQHYNSCLLDFAAAQFAEGKKSFGLRLVRLLASADPDLSWSSMRIPPVSIQKILAGMEADDGTLADLLKEATRDWHQRERDYKP